jgi:hypothetical protein
MPDELAEPNRTGIPGLAKGRPNDLILECAVIDGSEIGVELFVFNQLELNSLSRKFVKDCASGAVGLKQVLRLPTQFILSFGQLNH